MAARILTARSLHLQPGHVAEPSISALFCLSGSILYILLQSCDLSRIFCTAAAHASSPEALRETFVSLSMFLIPSQVLHIRLAINVLREQ